MNKIRTVFVMTALGTAVVVAGPLISSNIDPAHKVSWSENFGWMNWRDANATSEGVVVGTDYISGSVWFENGGWFNVGDGLGPYANTNGTDFGVNILVGGDLDGFAWSENHGWANLGWAAGSGNPDRARFDSTAQRFRGWFWMENAGWVNLDDSSKYAAAELTACVASAPMSDGMPKNRYLTFVDANPGSPTAIRVTVTSMPAAFAALNGTIMWVGPPEVFSENAGKIDPIDAPGFPTFTAATLQCDPYYTNWDSYGDMIHVYDEVIVPDGAYDLQAIGFGCEELNPANYSPALSLTQSKSGDVVSNCAADPCGPPNGSIDVTTDVTSVLNKFKNLAGAPIKARSDLDFNLPDQKVNISDVTQALAAFGGFPYPFDPGPDPCP